MCNKSKYPNYKTKITGILHRKREKVNVSIQIPKVLPKMSLTICNFFSRYAYYFCPLVFLNKAGLPPNQGNQGIQVKSWNFNVNQGKSGETER